VLGVQRVAVGLAAVALVADHVGEVLMKRATQGDVHQLHAPADAQHRQPARPRRADQ